MKEFHYVITDDAGIHARPAGMLVKEASKFQSNIQMKKDEKTADAKRIFGLMGLMAKKGDTVVITAEGEDEEQAITALESCLKEIKL